MQLIITAVAVMMKPGRESTGLDWASVIPFLLQSCLEVRMAELCLQLYHRGLSLKESFYIFVLQFSGLQMINAKHPIIIVFSYF